MKRFGLLLFLLIIGVSPVRSADQYDRQYRAVVSDYFISQHYAVPLFSNGNIEKGDILQYPEEARVITRNECFDLGKIDFRNIDALSITLKNGLSIGVGVGIPANKIAAIEASLGGRLSEIHQILIDPASRFHSEREVAERYLKKVNSCEVARLVVQGRQSQYILASDVMRGKISAESTINLGSSGKLDARITQETIQKLLGSTPRVSLEIKGNTVAVHGSRSPDVRSIAVKSRFVSTFHMGRLFALYSTRGGRQLEQRVQELLTNQGTSYFEKMRAELFDYLEKVGVREPDKRFFYNKMFYLEVRDVLDEKTLAKIPKEHWRALGITAAAHELAVW